MVATGTGPAGQGPARPSASLRLSRSANGQAIGPVAAAPGSRIARDPRGRPAREGRAGGPRPGARLARRAGSTAGSDSGHHGAHAATAMPPSTRPGAPSAPPRPAEAAGPKHGRLTFLGHSTVLIEVDDLRILMDPVLREGLGPVRRQVQAILPELFADLDAVFISHGHHDHLDLAVPAPDPGPAHGHRPAGVRRHRAAKAGLGPVEEVEPGDRLDHRPRPLRRRPRADHSGKREPFGPDGPAIGCVVAGSRTVYFPGDTDLFPGMDDLAGASTSRCCPCGAGARTIGQGHMNPERAAQAVAMLRPAPRRADPLGDLLPGRPAAGGARRRSRRPARSSWRPPRAWRRTCRSGSWRRAR